MNGLKLDLLDAKILFHLDKAARGEKNLIPSHMARQVFNVRNGYELKKCESLLRARLEKLMSFDLVLRAADGRTYGVNVKTCWVRTGDLVLRIERDGEMRIGSGVFVICHSGKEIQCLQV